MSVSMWSYRPEVCDGEGCPGDCDLCDKPKNMEDEDDMSVSKWAYDPEICDGDICVGDCDLCDKPKIAQIHNTATTQVQTDYSMSRYIDADKLMNFANNMKDKTIDANDIARFPTADVRENVKGEWVNPSEKVYTADGRDTTFMFKECSHCHATFPTIGSMNYCPNCGADMRGEA